MKESDVSHGELLAVPERVIIAPAPGRFRPITNESAITDPAAANPAAADPAAASRGSAVVAVSVIEAELGDESPGDVRVQVAQEQVIGYVDGIGQSTPVRSPFPGRLMGLLAHAGERVREGQPVAWLRLVH